MLKYVWYGENDVSELLGQTLEAIHRNSADDELLFILKDGTKYKMYHSQDCCESVSIEDITGELSDLVGTPLTMAEEVSNYDPGPIQDGSGYTDESYTWTFYKFATVKGYVTIRWYGNSNGYYSERVSFVKVSA